MEVIVLKHNNKICGYYQSKSLIENFINNCISCNFIKKTDTIELEYYEFNTNILIKKELLYNTNKNLKIKLNKKTIKVNKAQYEEFSDSDTTSVGDVFLDNDTDSDKEIVNKTDSNKNKDIADKIDSNKNKDIADKTDSESLSDNSITLDAEAFLKKKREERELQQKMVDYGQQKINILSQINKLKLEKQKMVEKKTKYDYDLQLYEKFKQLKKDVFNFDIPVLFKDKFILFERLESNNDLSFESFNTYYTEPHLETQFEDLFNSESHAYKLPKPEDFKTDDMQTLISAAF